MSSVTQLRRNATARLAEVSGAPRPVLTPTARAVASEPAQVIPLRSGSGLSGVTDEPTGPTEALGQQAPAASEQLRGAPSARTDEASSLRISGIARSVTQGALEVLAGTRPLQQMARWLDPENYERLQLRANLVRCIDAPELPRGKPRTTAHRHVVVRSARVCPVSPGVYEASVVAYDQKRIRAVALRIEQRRGAWRVTALEIG
ncbi:Rv3235 family protein [Arthrobacter sp. NamB2]|uniref:Rv3235 family protein n=1 Tax=Arthrobacter sp. NamB2 TaxID=2576035 RepID=UPI001CB8EB67|nr:Rv3235 family protein [Arthrobacter sp. NamB2]